ncbi:MAG: hypothetical protein H7841_01830 [Magnetospirillum sp. WYHS-4]
MRGRVFLTILAGGLAVAGCVTGPGLGEARTTCEQQFAVLKDQIGCQKKMMEPNRQNPFANMSAVDSYFNFADLVARKVEAREISEVEGRLKISEMFTQMRMLDLQQRQADRQWQMQQDLLDSQMRAEQDARMRANAPRTYNCTPRYGGTYDCTRW